MENSTVSLLRQAPLFADMDTALLEELAVHSRRRKFGPNQALFHEGDPGYTLYIVLSGQIRIQRLTESGEVTHIVNRGPGEVVGELALIDGAPRMADAVTIGACELLILHHEDFMRCVQQSSRFALSVMSNLAQRLRQAAQQKEDEQELDVWGRVEQALLELMRAHGVEESGGGTRLDAKITRQTIADQVRATRESVSRVLSAMQKQGGLCVKGRTLVILDMKKLKQQKRR